MHESCVNDPLKTMHSIKYVLQIILDYNMALICNEILIACVIFMTLLVAVVNTEYLFSKLKINKFTLCLTN